MNLNEETEKHKPAIARIAAVLAGGILMILLVAILRRADMMPAPYYNDPTIGTIQNLGKVLLDEYFFPFEFASVLFLSAMIGAVLLAKKDKTQAAS